MSDSTVQSTKHVRLAAAEEDIDASTPQSTTMDSRVRTAVDALHAHCAQHKIRCVLYVVGGGALSIGWLFGRPGASSWLLEAKIPYGMNSMRELFNGKVPGSFCSAETCVELSRLACQRAQRLSEESVGYAGEKIRFLGVGFTGALSSHQPKKGGSRCFLATSLETGYETLHSAKLEALGRDEEERITSEMIIAAIAGQLKVDTALTMPKQVTSTSESHECTVTSLSDSSWSHLLFSPIDSDSHPLPNAAFRGLVFPGSFNPLHDGHLALAKAASKHFPDKTLCFELSMNNVDKPALANDEVLKRVRQFKEHSIIVTKAPRFFEKAAILPGSVFVIGADTAIRLVDTKYYDSEMDKIAVLSKMIYTHQCHFLVGGRLDSKLNRFTTCQDEVCRALPRSIFEAGFTFLTESEFRVDLSSTELRQLAALNGNNNASL